MLKVMMLEMHFGRDVLLSFLRYRARRKAPKPPGVMNP
jgi:hypothetical protein